MIQVLTQAIELADSESVGLGEAMRCDEGSEDCQFSIYDAGTGQAVLVCQNHKKRLRAVDPMVSTARNSTFDGGVTFSKFAAHRILVWGATFDPDRFEHGKDDVLFGQLCSALNLSTLEVLQSYAEEGH